MPLTIEVCEKVFTELLCFYKKRALWLIGDAQLETIVKIKLPERFMIFMNEE